MKRFLQKSLFRLHSLLLLVVMSVVGIGSAWAESVTFNLTGSTQFNQKELIPVMYTCTQWTSGAANGLDFYGSSQTMTFVVSEVEITKVVFYGMTNYYGKDVEHSLSAESGGSWENGNNSDSPATWIAPEECTTAVFSPEGDSDFWITKVEVFYQVPVVEETPYTINFENAPDDAYITLNGETINKINNGYTIAKKLNEESVTYVYEPSGYYADVTYDADSHTFTVTYNAGFRIVFGKGSPSETQNEITFDSGYYQGAIFKNDWGPAYGRGHFCTETMKINKIEMLISGDATCIYEENGFGTTTYDGNTVIWTAPATGTSTDICFYSTSTSQDNKVQSAKVYYEPLPEIEYTVNITSDGALPADFTPYVTVDDQEFNASGTYRTPKTLSENSVYAETPNEDWYYDVDYVEGTHTFTVTYKEYNHYVVNVTGCEEETAGVRVKDGWQTYKDDDKINVKEELTVADLTVVEVNGYVAAEPAVSGLEGHNGTVTIPYTDAAEIPYTVTITGMPDGAKVMVEEEEFTASGTHNSRKTLDEDDVRVVNCPSTHYYNESYQWYDEGTHTFTITFTPYLAYTVAVADASAYKDADAGVKVKTNGNTYHVGEPIYVKSDLTEDNVEAAEVDGYTGIVTLTDKEFTVSYTKNDYILFKAGYYDLYSYGSVNDTKEDVSLETYETYSYGPNGYEQAFVVNARESNHISLTSTGSPIVKVELDYLWSDGDRITSWNVGSMNSDNSVWQGKTNNLEIWDYNNRSTAVKSIKVWLAQPIDYTINITGMPEGDDNYHVVANYDVENGKFTTNGEHTYTTTDELNENSVNCTYPINPQTYKVDKTYNAETKTYDVTYTALTQYNVVADADNAYTGDRYVVRVNDAVNYKIGDTFYLDGTLEESNISLITQDGYTGSFVLNNDATPKTITVKYVEKPAETYTVVFAGEVPEGASVTITDAAGDRTISNEDADKTFQSRYTYTDASAKAKAFEYYDAIVALDGTTFTVTYSKVDYIYVDLTTDEADRTKVTSKSTAETVSVNFTAWDGMAEMCSGWPITVTSATYNIAKIEYVSDHGSKNPGTSVSAGTWTTEFEVWEAGSSKTKSVVYDASTSGSDVYYTAVKVYLDTDPVGQFAMSAAGWATLFVDVEYALPDGYTAYTAGKVVGGVATLVEDEKIILTEIDRVPANTAVLISGPENANVELLATYGAVAPEVNFLKGATYATTWYAAAISDWTPGNDEMNPVYGSFGPCQLYQLAKENDVVGFYRQVADGSILESAANKAFLVVPTSAASSNARFVLPGQEEGALTGIDAIATEGAEAIYNLQGQRVNATKAGVYVKNGRKVIVK